MSQDREIRLAHVHDRFRTAADTAANTAGRHNTRIHPETANRLKEVGLYDQTTLFWKTSEQDELIATTQPSSVSYAPMETSPV